VRMNGKDFPMGALRFQTAFVRPDALFFSYWTGMPRQRHVLWSSRDMAHVWWSIRPGVEGPMRLSMAVAAMFGVSDGTSGFIPELLLPGLTDSDLTHTRELKPAGEEVVAGQRCWVIEGQDSFGAETFWVSVDSGLILRRRTRTRIDPQRMRHRPPREASGAEQDPAPTVSGHRGEPDGPEAALVGMAPFTSESTTDYEPKMNLEIPAATFDFHPPEGGL